MPGSGTGPSGKSGIVQIKKDGDARKSIIVEFSNVAEYAGNGFTGFKHGVRLLDDKGRTLAKLENVGGSELISLNRAAQSQGRHLIYYRRQKALLAGNVHSVHFCG